MAKLTGFSRLPILSRRQLVLGGALMPMLAHPAMAETAAPGMAALIVGVDRYRSIRPLTRAVADARAIAARMQGFGYDVTLALDADTDGFFKAQRAFHDRLNQGGGAAFCYFAGHGIQVGGKNYLLPADVDARSDEAMLETSIPLDTIVGEMAALRTSQSIIVLDACRNEPVTASLSGQGQGLAATLVPNGFYLAYAAASGEFAVDNLGDDDRDPNGLFARSLLRHLSATDSFDDIVKRVRVEVYRAAQAIGRSQHPAIYDQTVKEFCLDPKAAPRTGPSAVPEVGRMPQCAALLIGVDRYPGHPYLSLQAPMHDLRRVGEALGALGVEATHLRNPDSAALRAGCRAVLDKGADTILVYYSGQGALVAEDGAMTLPAPGAPDPDVLRLSGFPNVESVTAGALLKMLSRPRDKARDTAPRLILLLDHCLEDIHHEPIGTPEPSLMKALRERMTPDGFSGVAMILGTSLLEVSFDGPGGVNSSPFGVAVQNMLSRPGLTISQFAVGLRDEVEEITRGQQTPSLYASEGMREFVMVKPADRSA
jgi:uncharacterized caspase-like protein